MSSTYSTSLRIQLIDTGTEDEAWGIPTDNNLGTIIEQAITGVESVSLTNLTNYTLTAANAAADQSRNAVLVFTGALSANCNVIAPAVNKVYVISNQTTGGKNISITVGSGTNVAVANGTNQLVYCNGTSFKSAVDVNTIIGNLAVSGNSTVGGNVTVGSNVVMANTLTTTNGNLSLRSTTSNVVNFQGSTGALIPPSGTTAQRPSSPVVGMSRWNTTLGWYEIWNGIAWQQITGSFNVNYLIVAGGGGGDGVGSGGGGAGGFLSNVTTVNPGTSYPITVGAGGNGSVVGAGTNGANSTAFGFTAIGGGRGGGSQTGYAGGSGGGGGSYYGGAGGAGTVGQGNNGGAGNGGENNFGGGGGGGAGQAGINGTGSGGGNGGNGLQSAISGINTYYAGGGGGANDVGLTPSVGGAGGGGPQGGSQSAVPNTGGGGAGYNGYGGSGIVIVSYSGVTQRATGGTVTSYSSSNITYWVHTFTASGTFAT